MAAALKNVNEAFNTAEKQLDKLDTLPSARMPRQVCLHTATFTPLMAVKLAGHTACVCSKSPLHLLKPQCQVLSLCMELQSPVSLHW